MVMKTGIPFLFLLFSFPSSFSQNISSYTDYLQKFYVVDNGRPIKLEHLPITSVKTSDDYLAYEDNVKNFKVYFKGESIQLAGFVDRYTANKGVVIYEASGVLKAFSNGENYLLSPIMKNYKSADNIVAYVDEYDRAFKVFTDTIYTLENLNGANKTIGYQVAPNTLAYVDEQSNLYYYQNGKKQLVLEYFENGGYRVGENIVAFIDSYDYTFKTYYKDEIMELDTRYPQSYKMGKNMLAWIAKDGTFSVFYDGEVTELASYSPMRYALKDDVLTYEQNGYLYMFYKGEVLEIETYIPEAYFVDNQTLVYFDQTGYVKAYIAGKFVEITRQVNTGLKLNGDAIYYTVNQNEPRVWFKGRELEF